MLHHRRENVLYDTRFYKSAKNYRTYDVKFLYYNTCMWLNIGLSMSPIYHILNSKIVNLVNVYTY